jgi:hypothetical protein
MKQKRRNRFFTFIFSFLPGAAEMYMGFMKNGVTLMSLFFLSFAPMVFFSSLEFISVIGVIVWFYGFFHARNYAAMNDAEFFGMEDRFVWEELGDVQIKAFHIKSETVKKWIAAALIFIGVAQLWDYFFDAMVRLIPESYWDHIYPFLREVPQVALAVLFIVVGFRMILGKKKELVETVDTEGRLIAELPQKKEPEAVSETKEA